MKKKICMILIAVFVAVLGASTYFIIDHYKESNKQAELYSELADLVNLITRIKDGNKGFDFDYNLIIPHPGQGYHYKADVIKSDFIEAFKIALKGTQYSFPKDSTSAITVKMVDKVNSKIKYSCDFAIMNIVRAKATEIVNKELIFV